jgi:dTDP-4-dehydrorhamnose 3,5-epimerase
MRFCETPLKDACLIELDIKHDERGSFCRLFCQELFEKLLIDASIVQINESVNVHRATLRGMHYQIPPYAECKVVYCMQGSIYDVIVDLRSDSPTYGQHFGVVLQKTALFVPKGFAHGFITLEEDSRLLYLMSDFYKPNYESGFRYNDPAFDIEWPLEPAVISQRDQNHEPFGHLCKI